MADNIKDLTLETATDEVKTDEAKTDEIETVSKEDAEVESVAATKSTLLGATANSTEDIPATSFTTKTAPDGTDNLILFNQNTNVGYQIDYDNLADAILNKITSKTFSNQVGGSSAATLLSQLATLNSNRNNNPTNSLSHSEKTIQTLIDEMSWSNGTVHFITTNSTTISNSGYTTGLYYFGIVIVNGANAKTVVLWSYNGQESLTFSKSNGTWGSIKKVTYSTASS